MPYSICSLSTILFSLFLLWQRSPSQRQPTSCVSWWSYLPLPSHPSSLYQLLGFSWQPLCIPCSPSSSPNTCSREERVAVIEVPAEKRGDRLWAAVMTVPVQNYALTFLTNSKYFILLAKWESWIVHILMAYKSSCDRSWWWRHLPCLALWEATGWVSTAIIHSAV